MWKRIILTATLIVGVASPALAQVDCDGPAWDLSCGSPPPPVPPCDVAWDLSCTPTSTTTTITSPGVSLPPADPAPAEGVSVNPVPLVEPVPVVEAVALVVEPKPAPAVPVVWDVIIPRPAFGVHPV